jgi:hypothetical protein
LRAVPWLSPRAARIDCRFRPRLCRGRLAAAGRAPRSTQAQRHQRGIHIIIIIERELLHSPLRLILRPIGLIAIGRCNTTDVVSPMAAIRAQAAATATRHAARITA